MPASDDKIFRAIGGSLHNWSLVEMAMADLFASQMGPDGHRLSHAAFAAIISFKARLAVLNRLMEFVNLSDVERSMWDKLSLRLSKHYRRRHQLAHFTLGTDQKKKEQIISPFLTTDNWRDRDLSWLTTKQIIEISKSFSELKAALDWFAKHVVRTRMPLQVTQMPPLEEPPSVVRLRELATQSLAEKQPPHQSDPE